MARRTSQHFAFPVWRLKGISEGIGAELEGAEGRNEVGKGAQRNTKIPGSEFIGRASCSPGKGHSSHSPHERSNLEVWRKGLERAGTKG